MVMDCIAKLISDLSNTLIMAITSNTRRVCSRVGSSRILESTDSRLLSSTMI